jgi:hypothetical protein
VQHPDLDGAQARPPGEDERDAIGMRVHAR